MTLKSHPPLLFSTVAPESYLIHEETIQWLLSIAKRTSREPNRKNRRKLSEKWSKKCQKSLKKMTILRKYLVSNTQHQEDISLITSQLSHLPLHRCTVAVRFSLRRFFNLNCNGATAIFDPQSPSSNFQAISNPRPFF